MKQYRTDPLTDREKRHLRQVRGTKQPFSVDAPPAPFKAVREHLYVGSIKVPRKTKRGFNGCKLSPEKRAMVGQRDDARREFFASLGVKV